MFVIELHSIYILVCYLSERPRVWKAQILLLLLLLLLLYWVVPKSLKGVPSWALGNGRSPEATLDIKCLHCKWHPWTLDHPLRCFKLILEILYIEGNLGFQKIAIQFNFKGATLTLMVIFSLSAWEPAWSVDGGPDFGRRRVAAAPKALPAVCCHLQHLLQTKVILVSNTYEIIYVATLEVRCNKCHQLCASGNRLPARTAWRPQAMQSQLSSLFVLLLFCLLLLTPPS